MIIQQTQGLPYTPTEIAGPKRPSAAAHRWFWSRDVIRSPVRRGEENQMAGLISCDDHMDLGQLPADLWLTRLPAALRDRAPRIEERDGQAVWICDGKVWGSWSGKQTTSGAARPVKPLYNAFDRAQIYDQTERRPAVAELRLADMDRDGVETQVIFG